MYFEYVFNIKGEEGAGVAWELYIYGDFEFFGEMFLIDYKVTIDFGRSEVVDGHDT
jgi:hypothetical protein